MGLPLGARGVLRAHARGGHRVALHLPALRCAGAGPLLRPVDRPRPRGRPHGGPLQRAAPAVPLPGAALRGLPRPPPLGLAAVRPGLGGGAGLGAGGAQQRLCPNQHHRHGPRDPGPGAPATPPAPGLAHRPGRGHQDHPGRHAPVLPPTRAVPPDPRGRGLRPGGHRDRRPGAVGLHRRVLWLRAPGHGLRGGLRRGPHLHLQQLPAGHAHPVVPHRGLGPRSRLPAHPGVGGVRPRGDPLRLLGDAAPAARAAPHRGVAHQQPRHAVNLPRVLVAPLGVARRGPPRGGLAPGHRPAALPLAPRRGHRRLGAHGHLQPAQVVVWRRRELRGAFPLERFLVSDYVWMALLLLPAAALAVPAPRERGSVRAATPAG